MGNFTLKLDMNKAYDHVKWHLVEDVLLKMGFDRGWVEFVMRCVRSIRYFVVFNGKATGSIVSSRVLREGDPLSSFLFVFCSEGLAPC